MIPDLIPCPFCGGRPALNNLDWLFGRRRVVCACTECRAQGHDIEYRPGPDGGAKAEAEYAAACAWNTRAPVAA